VVESGRHGLSLGESVIRLLVLGRRHVPDRLMQPVVVNQSTHSNVAYSTASRVRHGPRAWITTVLTRGAVPRRR